MAGKKRRIQEDAESGVSQDSNRVEIRQIMETFNARLKRKQESIHSQLQLQFSQRMKKAAKFIQDFTGKVEQETAYKVDEIEKKMTEYTLACRSLIENLHSQLETMHDECDCIVAYLEGKESSGSIDSTCAGPRKKSRKKLMTPQLDL